MVAITARPVVAARKFVPEPFIQNLPLSTNATSRANLAHGHKMRNQESGIRNQESGIRIQQERRLQESALRTI